MKVRLAAGYSLMEVLVALLVLSAGMIGAAGLQLSAWRLSQQSSFHSAAHHLAAEMAEWLQVHRDRFPASLQTLEMNAESAAINHGMHCYGISCTADQLVSFMVSDWQARLQDALPEARARICRDSAPWDDAASAYRWACTAPDEDTPLVIKIAWMDKQALEERSASLIVISAGT